MSVSKLFVPGIVFQSVLIGGGYASGREIVEYSSRFGIDGSFVIIVSGILFSAFLFLAFEFSRISCAYDYGSWAKSLLGKYWIMFDVLFIIMAVIATAVVTSTVATTLNIQLKISYSISTVVVIASIGLLSYLGTRWLVRFKAYGTLLLYVAYVYICGNLIILSTNTPFVEREQSQDWWILSSIVYVGYNLVAIPACFFAVRELQNKQQVAIASIIGGLMAVLPMSLIYVVLVKYPQLESESLPLLMLINEHLGIVGLLFYFSVLLHTLLDTGAGLVHAITQRIDWQLLSYGMTKLSSKKRTLVAVIVVFSSVVLAQVGLINLISKWYGGIAWGFWVFFAIPLLFKLRKIIFS